jgi:hypothetical protein
MHTIKSGISVVLALAVLLGLNVQGLAQEKDKEKEKPKKGFLSAFRDSEDGAFDMSDWLLQKKGFLLMPTIITEPAIGYGLAGALVWFHSSYSENGPPSMSGVLGAYTESDTWAGGVFHYGFWKKDRIRYQGILVRTNLNVNYYGSGNIAILGDRSINLNMDAWYLHQQLTFRLGQSNFFAGARYEFMPTDNTFEIPIEAPGFSGQTMSSTLSEASALLIFDSRNNVFTPTKGVYLEVSGTYSDTWFGGDALYGRINAVALGYFPAADRVSVGFRYDLNFSLGDIMFWARPWIGLRGVPQMKYQNRNTAVMEGEVDWNLYKRWTLLAFAGIGTAFDSFGDFDRGKSARAVGTGFRYKIARKLGMDMGMDFAWSNDDFAFYLVVGTSWAR